ncbi:unnamed protein product [Cuscuta campestris]|uniref:Uncharacterized protein n=1 Tax=Cuscuta campestris TaxID=132261 RepID=A0A484ND72_9ASTE|nr:unnamed protein product [Cuscuta campestris]
MSFLGEVDRAGEQYSFIPAYQAGASTESRECEMKALSQNSQSVASSFFPTSESSFLRYGIKFSYKKFLQFVVVILCSYRCDPKIVSQDQ